MSKPELTAIHFHEDSELFQESVRFTTAETGFAARLIEKDYFCTMLLAYLAVAAGDDLVFKGGTCLAKVHAEMYRLSEDLDFTIPTSVEASRSERRKLIEGVKGALTALRKQVESQLRPVLRERDFVEFDLERAFKTVAQMAKAAA
jgi:predicted nucleotidyltransferase component of viral defense system